MVAKKKVSKKKTAKKKVTKKATKKTTKRKAGRPKGSVNKIKKPKKRKKIEIVRESVLEALEQLAPRCFNPQELRTTAKLELSRMQVYNALRWLYDNKKVTYTKEGNSTRYCALKKGENGEKVFVEAGSTTVPGGAEGAWARLKNTPILNRDEAIADYEHRQLVYCGNKKLRETNKSLHGYANCAGCQLKESCDCKLKTEHIKTIPGSIASKKKTKKTKSKIKYKKAKV